MISVTCFADLLVTHEIFNLVISREFQYFPIYSKSMEQSLP